MELNKQPDSIAVIRVENVRKKFRLYHEKHETLKETILARKRSSYTELWALDGVSYEFEKGRTYGIIGENGSGKSTLLKTITRILRPDTGSIEVNGRTSALLELGAGFHPELTGRENIYLNGAILRLSRTEIDAKYDDIVDFSEMGEFIDTSVKNYSSGMYMRLGFAIAVNVDPDILLIDEVLAVGDQSFQNKCYGKISDFQQAGKTIVFVSHDMSAVQKICTRVIYMDKGVIVADGEPALVISQYLTNIAKQATAKREYFSTIDIERGGSGEAEILSAALLDDQDQPVDTVESGQHCIVRIKVRFHEDTSDPMFGMSIFDSDQKVMYDTNTVMRGRQTAAFVAGQEIDINYRLRMSIFAGNYDISASVANTSNKHFYDIRNHLCPFSVSDAREAIGSANLASDIVISEADGGRELAVFLSEKVRS